MKTLLSAVAFMALSFAAHAETLTVTLKIDKMTCVTCPVVIKGALNKLEGINSVVTDLDTKTATVTYDTGKVTVDAMQTATENAGFPAVVAGDNQGK